LLQQQQLLLAAKTAAASSCCVGGISGYSGGVGLWRWHWVAWVVVTGGAVCFLGERGSRT